MNEIFSKWKEQLLDLGRSNPLINFKPSKSKTLKILYPEMKKVFNQLTTGSGNVVFFDTDGLIKNSKEDSPLFDTTREVTSPSKNEKVDEEELIKLASKNMLKNEFLLFNGFNDVNAVVKNLRKISVESMQEKGINILYVAVGFLNWQQGSDSFYSPILLCPVQITNNGLTFYEEDDIVTNPALLYKFRKELNIEFPEFSEDEDNTIEQYIQDLQHKFYNKGWLITEDIYLGTFAFFKINIYKDYEENENIILQNENVRKLLALDNEQGLDKIAGKENENEMYYNKFFAEGRDVILHNIVDADSSQQEAILRAKSGESFVLQGPPGTGKSQTITNLIAEFLYDGKKVLFVSEKLAALNVVYDKLKKAGLEDFCLELHSHKANKKFVIDELVRVLNRNKVTMSDDAKKELNDLLQNKTILDKYCNELHKPIKNFEDMTPYKIINNIEKLKDTPIMDYPIKNKNQYDSKKFSDVVNELEKFGISSSACRDYRKSDWYGYIGEDLSFETIYNLKNDLYSILEFVKITNEKSKKLSYISGMNIDNISKVFYYSNLFGNILRVGFSDKVFLKRNELKDLIFTIESFNKTMQENIELKKQIDGIFDSKIYECDSKKIYLMLKKKYSNIFRIISLRYNKIISTLKKLLLSKTKINYKIAVQVYYTVSKIKDNQDLLKRLLAKIYKFFKDGFDDKKLTSWSDLYDKLNDVYNSLDVNMNDFNNFKKQSFDDNAEMVTDYVNYINQNYDIATKITQIQSQFDDNILNLYYIDLNNLEEKLESMYSNIDEINNYVQMRECIKNIENYGAKDFVDKYLDNGMDNSVISDVFQKMFYQQYIHDYLKLNQTFNNFSGDVHNQIVEKFSQKDRTKFNISKSEIIYKLSQQIPSMNNCVPGSQLSVLMREANKKRKQKSVRLLINEITELVQILKPCFLMSPLSVSTYLTGDDCNFDVVIFDEASQINPADAIGSIYRAKQCIIVGDSKQMPPSNFFNVTSQGEEFEDDDTTDFESILDLAVSAFAQSSLKWHYRSRTEDLISFSNKNFYLNSLNTFPSVYRDDEDMGIDFYYVEDGIFDRKTKTNILEAKKVAELVKEHYKNHKDRSVGVVAFSISQQDLIEKCINEEKENDKEFAEAIDNSKVEPMFIKNLETVQGDERDTIIFSIAYAKDKDGKFIHNFGPLNKKGGERRLNVAITRAKYNVKIVASILDTTIDLSKSEAVGTKLIKEYLALARNKNFKTESKSDENSKNYILQELSEFLNSKGYQTQVNFGNSDKKIDLVVKDKNSKYLLAIECDGKLYKESRTTRDRDRLRPDVLKNMGWKYIRLWSLDWINKKEKVKQYILEELKTSGQDNEVEESKKEDTEKTKSDFTVDDNIKVESDNLKSNFEVYKKFDITKYIEKNKSNDFENIVTALVENEQPINLDYIVELTKPLLKTIIKDSEVSRTLERLLKGYKGIKKVDDCYISNTKPRLNFRTSDNDETRRNINFVSKYEIKIGILKLIELSIGIDSDNIVKNISNLLGFKRLSNDIKQRILESIKELEDENRIILHDDKYINKK